MERSKAIAKQMCLHTAETIDTPTAEPIVRRALDSGKLEIEATGAKVAVHELEHRVRARVLSHVNCYSIRVARRNDLNAHLR